MQSFGFNTFISILLPGVVVSTAVYLLLRTFLPGTEFCMWLESTQSQEFLFTGILVTSSSFFGALLGSFLGHIEWKILDRRAAKNLELKRENYDEQWRLYIKSLSINTNPYVSGKALTFYFESRTAISFLVLALSLFIVPGYLWLGVLFLLLSFFMLFLAKETHYLLAYIRNEQFGEISIDNLKKRSGSLCRSD